MTEKPAEAGLPNKCAKAITRSRRLPGTEIDRLGELYIQLRRQHLAAV